MCCRAFILSLWLNGPLTHSEMYIRCYLHTQGRLSRQASDVHILLWAVALDESVWTSPETCSTSSAGIPPLNACKMCENMSWNNLVFLYSCRLKSPGLVSGWTWEGRLRSRHLTLPRHAATAFTSSSQRSRGQRAPSRVRYSRPVRSLYRQPPDVWSGLFYLACGFTRASVPFLLVLALLCVQTHRESVKHS